MEMRRTADISSRLFNRWAPGYDHSILQGPMFSRIHDTVLDARTATGAAPRDLLDVGCGTGRLLELAARRWGDAELTGIDVSEKMIAEARRRLQSDTRFDFKQGDAAALPLADAAFDTAFSTMSFHHWGDQTSGIKEMARVLRPGGLFVLADVDAPLLVFLFGAVFDRSKLPRPRSPADIRRLLEENGLSVLTFRRFWALSRVQLFVARKNG